MNTNFRGVVILQKILPHYRIPFFDELDGLLRDKNIVLQILYSNEESGQVPKTINVNKRWAKKVGCQYYKLFGKTIYRMALGKEIKSNLLIAEHAASFINLYLILLNNPADKIALWGHGENLQGDGNGKIKDFILNKADWWFGYTEHTRRVLINKGYNQKNITIVNNSIDTSIFEVEKVEYDTKVKEIKHKYNIVGENICVYCGGIYSHKKIDFLLEASLRLANEIENFTILIIGEGPDQDKVENAAENNSCIKFVGPLFGSDRVPYLKMSKAMLMPGLVGLAIIDSFSAKTPIITTDIPIHSPEIEYMNDGFNGMMVEYDIDAYVKAVKDYLSSPLKQATLEKGCERSSELYSIQSMAENFAGGIMKCLES
ncbi:MAG: glycosyltransferase family 4 protein [Gammaproteobacteria bacterium]|nr:glycosyltransferase family 4 protein [Gammaproteobacteria bacterium]